jgi:hypothetical protein
MNVSKSFFFYHQKISIKESIIENFQMIEKITCLPLFPIVLLWASNYEISVDK